MSPAPYPMTDGSEPCAQGDPERFHPDSGGHSKALDRVKAECTGCHIKDACLAYALTNRVSGIWAGTSGEERDEMRQARGIKAEPLTFAGLSQRANAAPAGHGSWAGVNHHRTRYEPNRAACREFSSTQARMQREKKAAQQQAVSA